VTGEGERRVEYERSKKKRAPKKRPPPPALDAPKLEELALAYLNRFDCSVQKLRTYLRGLIRRRGGDAEALGEHIEALLARYQANGLLNDERFASRLSESMQQRGRSRRAVIAKLRGRGIGAGVAEAAVPKSATNELEAAKALVKKRKLGPFREPTERAEKRQKDLGTLARAGFDHETARRALAFGSEDDF
jgi:regulatory protein